MRFARVVPIVLLLCACNPKERWDEEVLLSNGQVLQVRRTLEWAGTNAVGDSVTYGERVTRLSFRVPSGQVLSWSGVSEKAMILDYDPAGAQYFIVTAPMGCMLWQRSGKPRPPYFEYRLVGKQWQFVPLSPSHVGHEANLLVFLSYIDPPVDVDVQYKRNVHDAVRRSGSVPERMLSVRADAEIFNCR